MTPQNIEFGTPEAAAAYRRYTRRLRSLLPRRDREELLLDIRNHVVAHLEEHAAADEHTAVLEVLARLGDPETVAREFDENRPSRKAPCSNPALSLLKNSLSYATLGLLYLTGVTFAILLFAKILAPGHTGLFYSSGRYFSLGYISGVPAGVPELLGGWFFPLAALLTVICYRLSNGLRRLAQ